MAFPIFGDGVRKYHSSAQLPLGTVGEDDKGRRWVYVRFTLAVTYVSGHVCSWVSYALSTVTNDESGGSDIPAGVLAAWKTAETAVVPTEGQYGWIQFEGPHPAVAKANGSDAIAVGDAIIMHASTDGTADVASNTNEPTAADRARMIGRCNLLSEDGTTGTWRENTVGVELSMRAS